LQVVLLPHTFYVTFWIRKSCCALTDVMLVSSRARPTVLLLQPYARLSGYSRKCARLEVSGKHVTPFLGISTRSKPVITNTIIVRFNIFLSLDEQERKCELWRLCISASLTLLKWSYHIHSCDHTFYC